MVGRFRQALDYWKNIPRAIQLTNLCPNPDSSAPLLIEPPVDVTRLSCLLKIKIIYMRVLRLKRICRPIHVGLRRGAGLCEVVCKSH